MGIVVFKKMIKFHKVKVKKGKKYSDWEYPIMKKYQMACCDCGLVHEINFKVVKIIKKLKNNVDKCEDITDENYRIMMQARRNTKLTKGLRDKKRSLL